MRFEQNAVKFSKYFKPTLGFYSLKNSQVPSCHWCFVGRKSVRFKSTAWNTKSSSLPSSFHCLDLTFLCIIAALRSKCLKRAPSLRSFLSSSSFFETEFSAQVFTNVTFAEASNVSTGCTGRSTYFAKFWQLFSMRSTNNNTTAIFYRSKIDDFWKFGMKISVFTGLQCVWNDVKPLI